MAPVMYETAIIRLTPLNPIYEAANIAGKTANMITVVATTI